MASECQHYELENGSTLWPSDPANSARLWVNAVDYHELCAKIAVLEAEKEQAVRDEREACALLAERQTFKVIAKMIRARSQGEKEGKT